MKNNKIFVISGPSGVGKGALVECLLKRVPHISRSISVTTREPRVGETPDLHYHFVSKEEFLEKVKADEFLEWAKVHGNLYGTLKNGVDKELSKGRDIVLVIDVQGGIKVKKEQRDSVLIFIEPPSFGELRERLKERGTELSNIVEKRIKRAKEELKYAPSYDYKVVNDNLDKAIDSVISIIKKERQRI